VALRIRSVETVRDYRSFVKLPYRLHRDEPRWIAPLVGAQMRQLGTKTDLYFEHADAEYFLAERDGRLVGRVMAHIDHQLNEFQGNKWGLFGHFECADDPEAAAALLGAAEAWLVERGRDRMVGPLGRATRDDPGLLIEGYDVPPVIFAPWHPPYYRPFLEDFGFEKEIDAVWRELRVDDLAAERRGLATRWAGIVRDRYEVTIRPVRRDRVLEDLERAFAVIPPALEDSWGFVPSTEREISVGLKQGRRMLAPATLLAERDGEVIASTILLPDLNQVFAHMDGRLLPTGWARWLYYRRRVDRARNTFMAILPEYRHLGIAIAFMEELLQRSEQNGYRRIVIGFSWEDNEAMNLAMSRVGAEIAIRHRVYSKELDSPPGSSPSPPREPPSSE
jgi:GNAT superfamily N-acetyltransferase